MKRQDDHETTEKSAIDQLQNSMPDQWRAFLGSEACMEMFKCYRTGGKPAKALKKEKLTGGD